MALLPIIVAPDPRLKLRSRPVGKVDRATRKLMDDLLETMYAAPGVGLSAPQVGVAKRVLVVDVVKEGEAPQPLRMADPELVWVSDDDRSYEEGCLSVPEHYAEVTRPARVRVRYLDEESEIRERELDGLLATVVQHEMDHLDGILFIDHLTSLKRNMILRKLAKARRTAEVET